MTVSVDARIVLTRELLTNLLQLPEGWRAVAVASAPDDAVVAIDVVFSDGPVGAGEPVRLYPRYDYVQVAERRAVALSGLFLTPAPARHEATQ
jgi:hypothetical protein